MTEDEKPPGKKDEQTAAAMLPLGVGVGIALGAGLGAVLGNVGVGIGIGIAVGAGLGAAGFGWITERNKKP